MESQGENTVKEVDLSENLIKIARWWKLIIVATLLGGLIAGIYGKTLPEQFASKAKLHVKGSSKMMGILEDLPIALNTGGDAGSSFILAHLNSDSMAFEVIDKLKLARNSDFTGGSKLDNEKLLEIFRKSVEVKSNVQDETIVIKSTTHDPKLSANIVNSMLDVLETVLDTQSRSKSDYLKLRIDETLEKLSNAEEKLLKFQEKRDVTEIDEQTKAMIENLSELEARLFEVNSQISEIESALQNAGELESLVDYQVRSKALQSSKEYIETEIDEMKRELVDLPSIGLDYLRLKRNVEVLSKTYELLIQQYQLAKISQHGEGGDYQVIDRGRVVDKKVAPRISVMVLVWASLAFLGAVVVAAIIESLKSNMRKGGGE